MSIIERYSPLNLAYNVIIVTNASTPTGIIVCNTLMKANALVLGVDDREKHESQTEAKYTHLQFHRCKLADDSSVPDIIEAAKQKFKVENINGLVNLASTDDDEKTKAAHKKLAAACAENMEAANGGAIVETQLQAATADAKAFQGTDQVNGSKTSSKKVRTNIIAPSDKNDLKSCQEYDEAKKHLDFIYKPSHNPNLASNGTSVSEEKKKMFEFSNVALFLISGMSGALNGAVLDPHGQLVQG